MIESIMSMASEFNAFAKSNPVVAGVVSLYGLGIISFFSRNLPQKIWAIFKKQTTITLTLNNYNEIFFYFLEWFEEQTFYKNVRTLNAQKKRDSWNGVTMCGAGFGDHYFIYKGRPFKFSRNEKEANNTTYTKESIHITTIGRKKDPIFNLLKDIEPVVNKTKETKIYKWEDKDWNYSHKQTSQTLDSVVLPNKIKEKLIKGLKDFDDSEEWYTRNGVPYRFGILFKGPPGTGKTSLVKAICSFLEKDLYVMNLASMSDKLIDKAMSSVPKNTIVLAEDIDTVNVTKTRKAKPNLETKKENNKKKEAENSNMLVGEEDVNLGDYTWMTLSGLLNAIDGVLGSDGRVLIFTTNYPDKLDDALLRPGRIDLQLDIDFMDNQCIVAFFKRFYPDFVVPKSNFREKLSPAQLQQYVLENKKDPQKVLESIVVPAVSNCQNEINA